LTVQPDKTAEPDAPGRPGKPTPRNSAAPPESASRHPLGQPNSPDQPSSARSEPGRQPEMTPQPEPGGRRTQRPRDPAARRAALAAAAIEVIAEVGIGRTTHRAVAARAGLPLGATTYYFPTLDDLIAAGLRQATEAVHADLEGWAVQLREAADLPATLAGLARTYLADRGQAQIEYELFVAAARDPALRPLAEAWLTGMSDLLEPHVGGPTARTIVALLDGAILHALVTASDLDTEPLTAAIRRLTSRA
jgi:DNA-binding transcriptional regulator YbjK